ncbi:flavodoxin domain-containing protein [Blattabacterium cuenoti]|uniref:hypothetical protein n=1 Tax=Blattabacterium cuenoti TaxID=1653831 RepID=UPI001EECDB69|nr:hypothetical protein [Blattabacterium cuenoti]
MVNAIINFFQKILFNDYAYKKKIFFLLKKKLNIIFLSFKMLKKYSFLIKKNIFFHKYNWDLLNLLKRYPIPNNINYLYNLIKIMDPIKPRLYSISSSHRVHNNLIHITISRHQFKINEKIKYGFCSNFLSQLKIGDKISFSIKKNHVFKLPENNKDIILIGTGTGIAPFRSFLYEREIMQATGKNWLFFGNQYFLNDFLYHNEIKRWEKNRILYRVDVAFSRDNKKKIYIQHKIWENRKEFFFWIQKGAYIYICGKKKPMSIDVENTIYRIIEIIGKVSPILFIKKMKQEGRYLKDVY